MARPNGLSYGRIHDRIAGTILFALDVALLARDWYLHAREHRLESPVRPLPNRPKRPTNNAIPEALRPPSTR